MNGVKYLVIAIAIATTFNANAEYIVKIPIEQASGGFLTDDSITFTRPSDVGSNPVDPVTPENPDSSNETPVEKTGAELCDDRVQPTINFLAMNYSESSYKSHEFSDLYVAIIDPVHRDGCKVFVSIPKSKTYSCVKNNDYAERLVSDLRQKGFDGVYLESYGACQ
ncbi:hypothetical protein EON09_14150 [Pseudomonas soli]|jgi:hypothetical protein|uniref:hypothetical protein n=1 Tax=Pseudomonadota TaxID=1224 RepID=UPI00104121E0|nr:MULTISPECIES: hypothetical protein [Pseudomonadota]MBH4413025.1 hypothetical protein [Pseudomonas aeruginosa]MCE1082355.1 hypothetical protein [Pseudomonas asiatica]MCV6421368.1 hypothetical protein [Pseudomonas aeruginosa]NBK39657.1 hypothetical protein [Pseudomonas soli]HCF1680452.1 hypothetical protein [Pseudomonas aeruginosa]